MVKIIVTGSMDGVTAAATMATPTIAKRQCTRNVDDVTMPKRARK